jgi:hypothetical protein
MRSLILVPLAGLMSFTLAAFVPQSVDTSARGMVYGHLESPASIEQVELLRANSTRPHAARVLPNGDFYFSDLEPGEYVVLRFMTNGAWRDLAAPGAPELPLQVEQSGIHYVGAWRVSGTTMDRAAEPASDQLLRRLRPSLRGTGWEKLIKR